MPSRSRHLLTGYAKSFLYSIGSRSYSFTNFSTYHGHSLVSNTPQIPRMLRIAFRRAYVAAYRRTYSLRIWQSQNPLRKCRSRPSNRRSSNIYQIKSLIPCPLYQYSDKSLFIALLTATQSKGKVKTHSPGLQGIVRSILTFCSCGKFPMGITISRAFFDVYIAWTNKATCSRVRYRMF